MANTSKIHLRSYWAAHEELTDAFAGIDLEGMDLDTCRQVLDLASQQRSQLVDDVAPGNSFPPRVDPGVVRAADDTACHTITIVSAGDAARDQGDPVLAYYLDEVGYA